MALNIISGIQTGKEKVIIYGQAGSGKSTLASKFSKALFLDTEGGLNYLNVSSVRIKSFDEFMQVIVELRSEANSGKKRFDTIVIDSIDWVIPMITSRITGAGSGSTMREIESTLKNTLNRGDGSYGNGKQFLDNYIRHFLIKALQGLTDLGYRLVLIAHAERKILVNADGEDVSLVAPKIDTNTMNTFVEWVDDVFYIRKGSDGTRELIVDGSENLLVKNRHGLSGRIAISDDFDINKLVATVKK